jgi:hypothetical protein
MLRCKMWFICMNLWNHYFRYLWDFLGLILTLFWFIPYICFFLLHIALLFHFRFFLPVVHVTSPHSSRDCLLHIQPFAIPHLPVISHWSFILFHASGTSVHRYLLTINKTRGRYTLSLSSIFILHPFLPTHLLHAVSVANPWEILPAANFAICLFSFPSPPSGYLLIWFFFRLAFFFTLTFNLVSSLS